jgi:hypothetical protein
MECGDAEHAKQFRESAERHEVSACRHADAAALWEQRGDREVAALEHRVAELEQAAAELERDRARLFEQRAATSSPTVAGERAA